MELSVNWLESVPLRRENMPNFIYDCEVDDIPACAGVYIFGREHGAKFEALYIGKSLNIKTRIKQHFKNLPLMKHIEQAKSGTRVIKIGLFKGKQGQNTDKCIKMVEKALIDHYSLLGNNIANIQGTETEYHNIIFSGENIINVEEIYFKK